MSYYMKLSGAQAQDLHVATSREITRLNDMKETVPPGSYAHDWYKARIENMREMTRYLENQIDLNNETKIYMFLVVEAPMDLLTE